MVTGIDYFRHIYKVDSVLRDYDIYLVKKVLRPKSRLEMRSPFPLPGRVRIEPYKGLSKSFGIQECLRGNDSKRWAKNYSDGLYTGLRPIDKEHSFMGDFLKVDSNHKSLLLMQFSENREVLVIDYFRGFYPKNPAILQKLVSSHKFNF